MISSTVHTIGFNYVRIHLAPTYALSVFEDGSHLLLNMLHLDFPEYRQYAADCGYEGNTDRYAHHHDLVHHWLAEAHGGGPSPTLWAVAHGQTYPGWEREEHHVNCLQRLCTDQERGIEWRSKEVDAAREALGSEWHRRLPALARLLAQVA